MKLKLSGSSNMPFRVYLRSLSKSMNTWYGEEVIRRHLGVDPKAIDPSGHYIQWGDPTVAFADGKMGMEIGFSKVSAFPAERFWKQFHHARGEIQRKFRELIEQNVPKGSKMSLFICSQTDEPVRGPDGTMSTQHELNTIWVDGLAEPNAVMDVPLEHFLLAPMLHEVQRLQEITERGEPLAPYIVSVETFERMLVA